MTMHSSRNNKNRQRQRGQVVAGGGAGSATSSPVPLAGLGIAVLLFLWISEPVASFGLFFPSQQQQQQQQQQQHRGGKSCCCLFSSSASASPSSTIDESNSIPPQPESQPQHIVVVGGGVGGMAVAARIASEKSGAKVTLLEKNSDIGGRCGSFWVDPEHDTNTKSAETATKGSSTNNNLFRHEQGPSLLLLKSVYEDVFRETTASKTARDYGLEIVPCAPAYQIVFDDGDRITAGFPKDSCSSSSIKQEESKSRAKMDAYESEGAAKWDDYMAITAAYLDAGLPNFIQEKLDLGSLPNFLVQSLKDSAKAWPLKPHSDVLDALFESDKLKALASFQDLYVGLEPFRNKNDSNNLQMLGGGVLKSTAPAVFGLLAAIELHPDNKNAGVFAPIGGFQSVTNAFENLLDDLGVEIRCDTTVLGVTNEGVWARQDSSTSSDSSNNNNNNNSKTDDSKTEFIPADLIIVNADLPYAKNSLIMKQENSEGDDANVKPPPPSPPPPPLPEKFDWDDQFSFSSGVISFYWSLDKPLDDLNTHNVFLSTKTRSEAEAAWQVLRDSPEISLSKSTTEHNEDSPFNFYVHRPSKTDPSAAPPGCDTIMVLVPCRTLLRDDECANLPRREAMERYQTQFTETEIARVKKAVLKRLAAVESLQTLEDHILHEECRTPATWADRYNLGAGTPFALSHGFAQLSLTRPGPASSGLSNVLYCGASTRPGNGVPLVLIGAKQVAEKAVRSLNTQITTD